MRKQRIAGVSVIVAGLLAVPSPARADSWVPVAPAFSFGPNRRFTDVEGSGDGGAWAVGFQREKYVAIPGVTPGAPETVLVDLPPKPLLQRFDGTTWKNVVTVGLTDEGALEEVSAVSASDVWVSGYHHTAKRFGTTYLAHWDGQKWTKVDAPDPGKTVYGRHLSADTGGVWLSEDTRVSRLKDGSWTTHDLGMSVYGLKTFPSGEAWAQGSYMAPDVKHFDGTAWHDLVLPTNRGYYHTFKPTGPNTGWVATTSGLALWDGSAWTTVPYPDGYTGAYANTDLDGPWIQMNQGLLHWDGSAWKQVSGTAFPQVKDTRGRIWGAQSQRGASGAPATFLYRLDGNAWNQEVVYPLLSWDTRLTVLPGGLLYTGEDKDGNIQSLTAR